MLYGCALSPDSTLELVDFCFLSDFRIKQVFNLQFPLFVTTHRCYSKCSGVGWVQQVAKGVCMVSSVSFSRLNINRLWLPILHEVSWTGKIDSELETENRNTLQIFDTVGPFPAPVGILLPNYKIVQGSKSKLCTGQIWASTSVVYNAGGHSAPCRNLAQGLQAKRSCRISCRWNFLLNDSKF